MGHPSRTRSTRGTRLAVTAAVVGAVTLAVVGTSSVQSLATGGITRHVDGSSKSCTNTGTGATTAPYCTIQAAASAAQPGDTVLVATGTYTENVTINHSGTQSAPITFAPEPGANVTVSGQIHGFTVSGTSLSAQTAWIRVTGFNVTGTTQYGIYLKYATNITLDHNHVTYSGQPVSGSSEQGIYLLGTTNSLVMANTADHNSDTGIYATTGTTGVEFRANVSFANARQYTRAATGIDIRAPGNTVDGNLVHDNEDSGIQLYNGANGTIVYDNISYNNGDHGIDVLNSMSTVVVSNSVYNNVTAGINFEGNSTSPSSGATVRNNISVDNGLTSTTTKGDIRVDANSTPGTTIDYDMTYLKSAGTMVTWGTKQYTSLSALTTATGQESNGIDNQNGGNPNWVSPSTGDFHLQAGSKAIDSAASNAPNQPSLDFAGNPRVDDPATPNIGVGPRTYDDRGALEYQPNNPPTAKLSVSPSSGTAPLSVVADASASSDQDPGSPIATYAFDFGDGSASTGPQGDPTAQHAYSTAGTYTVTVTVTDTLGLSGTATAGVSAAPADLPPQAALTVTPNAGSAPLLVTADGSGSTDTDATPIATYTFDFGDGSAAMGPQSTPTAPHTYEDAGTFTVTMTVTDTGGLSTTATATVVVGNGTVDEVHYGFESPTSVTFDWRGGPSTIRYGLTGAYGASVTATPPDPMPFSSSGPFWEAQLSGLTPGTTYHYSIGGSADSTFTTEPTGSFRFDAEGDIGDSVTYPDVGTTQGQIAADAPAFVLGIGDLTYGEAHGQQAVDQHFDDVMGWSAAAAYMPAWGNHEWETSFDDLRNYKGRFMIPNQHGSAAAPSQGCCGEDWGWFDAGGARFVSYPEPYSTTTWSEWQSQADPIMADAQADPSIRYIVTFGHRPAYSTGSHSGESRLVTAITALGDKYPKYVLNLNGHSHDYERFVPIHGVVNITAGGGGATLEPPWTTTDPRTAFRAMHLAHLRVDVTPSAMTIAAICGPATTKDDTSCVLGSILDSVTIPAPPASDNPPTPALSVTPSSGAAPLVVSADASASTDGDTTPIASYTFGFGDGTSATTSAAPTATHTYSAAGTYTVTVTVTDTAGRASTATASVVVTPAQADDPPSVGLTASPTGGAAPLLVNADASSSTDSDQTPIASYTFAFGDGTTVGPQAGPTASHTYATPGKYTITVTATDTGGLTSTATATITVASTDAPPKATLTLSPASGPAPLLVRADASGSTDTDGTPIATYAFDFGDGTVVGPQAGATASHQYASAGSYTVVVTVTDTAGLASTAQSTVTVTNDAPPVASLTVTPTTGRAPLPVSADASASTDGDATPIASYRFDFGDGTVVGPQAGPAATHTYASAGTYTVKLTVTDTAGLASTASQAVTATTPAGTQFIGNSGFETSTTGWNANGRATVSLTRVTDPHSGSYAVTLTNTDAANAPDCTLNDSPNWVAKTESGTYTAALWVKAPTAGAKLTLRIREYNGSTNVGQATTSVTLSTTWQQIKLPYAPTTLGSNLDFTAYTSNTPPGTCFVADDATETLS